MKATTESMLRRSIFRWATLRSTSIARTHFLLKPVTIVFVVGILLGWLTIFRGYADPAAFFWDENYHVASAQKYLNGVFFQEPHPPLGKLLIAAGENLLDANQDDAVFINTNHADNPPSRFSFAGYRFFPVLLATLSVPFFGLLGLRLSGSLLAGLICCCAYALDNALVVHLRGAMLEGSQLFFLLAAFLAALASSSAPILAILAGLLAGAAMAVKINSLPAILLLILIIARQAKTSGIIRFIVAACAIWLLIWEIHFSIGQTLKSDTYKASTNYQMAIKAGDAGKPYLFITALKEALAFSAAYQHGVPALNMCKTQDNGSYPLLWPLGSQSINYRWDRKNGATSYLYLQSNPMVWLFSLLGIISALGNIWRVSGSPKASAIKSIWQTRKVELGLAFIYGAGIFLPLIYSRVFYLYHFFIPLLCGILAGAIAVSRISPKSSQRIVALLCICLFTLTFRYFAPLTYSTPLTDKQLAARSWSSLWNLRCAGCDSIFPIARPMHEDEKMLIALSGIPANVVTQGWGLTRMGLSDEGAPLIVANKRYDFGFGTHANGKLVFPIPEWATVFKSEVGVPDSYRGRLSSVQFAIEADGKEMWKSPIMRPGMQPVSTVVTVSGKQVLTLKITDGGDGITDDHGAWLEPVFK